MNLLEIITGLVCLSFIEQDAVHFKIIKILLNTFIHEMCLYVFQGGKQMRLKGGKLLRVFIQPKTSKLQDNLLSKYWYYLQTSLCRIENPYTYKTTSISIWRLGGLWLVPLVAWYPLKVYQVRRPLHSIDVWMRIIVIHLHHKAFYSNNNIRLSTRIKQQ